MASRQSPTSKIPKWNTPPPTPRVQTFTSNDSKKSISATSSPRPISFRNKPATSLTSGSKIPKRPSPTTQNEQPQNCNLATPAKNVGGGEGDIPATMVDYPNKAKDAPLFTTDQFEEEDLDNALVGMIKPFSDRDFTKFLHISAICEDENETLETIKPPGVSADNVSSTNSMESVRIPVKSGSSTFERKSTPIDLWLGAENNDVMVAPSILGKLRGRTEGLVNDLFKEAAVKVAIAQHGDCSDEVKTKEKEDIPIKDCNVEEDLSSKEFEELVTKLGAPTKSETLIMKQMDLEEDAQEVQESKSSIAEIQQVRSSDSRLRKYKIFLESSTDIDPKKSTSKPVVFPTTKTPSSHNRAFVIKTAKPEVSKVELQLGKETQERLSRHNQLDAHHAQNVQKLDVQNDKSSPPIVREVDVSLPEIVLQEEVCEDTEESQSDVEALGFGITDSEYGNESEDGDTCDDGEDMIINLDQLNSNDAVIGKKARTIFSVDLSMSKIQVKHGAGENGDGYHNEEWNSTATTSRQSKLSLLGAQSIPSLTKLDEAPKDDDSRITVVTRETISKPESHNSIHSLYSRKYNSGQRNLKKSLDQVDKQLEDEESTSSDEREVHWEFEKQFDIDVNRYWLESTMDQKQKKWLEQGARREDAGTAWRNDLSRLDRVEGQLATVNGHIKEIFDKMVYYRTATSVVVFACVLVLAIPAILPGLDEFMEKPTMVPDPSWWETLFGPSGKK